jgi:hypothetical protein
MYGSYDYGSAPEFFRLVSWPAGGLVYFVRRCAFALLMPEPGGTDRCFNDLRKRTASKESVRERRSGASSLCAEAQAFLSRHRLPSRLQSLDLDCNLQTLKSMSVKRFQTIDRSQPIQRLNPPQLPPTSVDNSRTKGLKPRERQQTKTPKNPTPKPKSQKMQ